MHLQRSSVCTSREKGRCVWGGGGGGGGGGGMCEERCMCFMVLANLEWW